MATNFVSCAALLYIIITSSINLRIIVDSLCWRKKDGKMLCFRLQWCDHRSSSMLHLDTNAICTKARIISWKFKSNIKIHQNKIPKPEKKAVQSINLQIIVSKLKHFTSLSFCITREKTLNLCISRNNRLSRSYFYIRNHVA